MAQAATPSISPFLIVRDVPRTLAFYGSLGFKTTYFDPSQPFFGIAVRDGAQILFKSNAAVAPTPNPTRHPEMRWDAFVYAPDPDLLAAGFVASGAAFSKPLQDTHDGLRGFELTDPDGYVLFFGRPR